MPKAPTAGESRKGDDGKSWGIAMSARQRMTMRCKTSRDVDSGAFDSYNQPVAPPEPVLRSHPCYWQGRSETLVEDGGKIVSVVIHRMMLPVGSDIIDQDTVTEIRDRRGRVVYDGDLHVKSALPRENLVAVVLEEYS